MTARGGAKGLRQFLDDDQQRAWLEGEATLPDAADREQSLELRFKYTGRFEKLLKRPQAGDVLDILRTYATTAIPIPRRSERFYWSVSCLPGSPDKPLARISASFMELFALQTARRSPVISTTHCSKAASTIRTMSATSYGRRTRSA